MDAAEAKEKAGVSVIATAVAAVSDEFKEKSGVPASSSAEKSAKKPTIQFVNHFLVGKVTCSLNGSIPPFLTQNSLSTSSKEWALSAGIGIGALKVSIIFIVQSSLYLVVKLLIYLFIYYLFIYLLFLYFMYFIFDTVFFCFFQSGISNIIRIMFLASYRRNSHLSHSGC